MLELRHDKSVNADAQVRPRAVRASILVHRLPLGITLNTLRKLLFLLTASICIGANAQVVWFQRNVAKIDIPPGYSYTFEDGRATLVLSPSNQPKVEIRLTFNSLKPYVNQRPTIGKDFVRDTATKKGKSLFDVPGNAGVAFIDLTSERAVSGEQIQDTHGLMGLDDGYLTFTITTTKALASSDLVKELVGGGIKSILGRVKSREG
jgi:hypothetical protein